MSCGAENPDQPGVVCDRPQECPQGMLHRDRATGAVWGDDTPPPAPRRGKQALASMAARTAPPRRTGSPADALTERTTR